ncbi:MAG TPA: hypothetical protein IGS17_18150 [Oscillatoriales cyanobacterium M59_W2019_021]|nr:MAG: hypothetical protein D6728_13430 [Cyanobacteria bacterium J055]HIK31931.1 hypothetical protein [Oscillatoriales cyanobacterium M4454_W2019_049]HIK52825.1 hypothetical protein [Oscillatoriales cyanobacterium M59_W2019_021]
MKRWMLTGGCALFVAVAATVAVPKADAMAVNSTPVIYQTTPFDLAYLAYRGELEAYGIPGYDHLLSALRSGRIDAEEIVDRAVAAGRVSADTAGDTPSGSRLRDRQYVAALEGMLEDLLRLGT